MVRFIAVLPIKMTRCAVTAGGRLSSARAAQRAFEHRRVVDTSWFDSTRFYSSQGVMAPCIYFLELDTGAESNVSWSPNAMYHVASMIHYVEFMFLLSPLTEELA